MAFSKLRVLPGSPYPLGATWDGKGVNFALFSANAEKVVLCLFDEKGQNEIQRIRMPEYTDEVWHVYLPDVRPGQLYGYRVFGPYEPEKGLRFNHNKLLLDPYVKALQGKLQWTDAHLGYKADHAKADLSFDRRNNARFMPKCMVVDTAFSWGEDKKPKTPWSETIIYEANVRGLTMLRPDVPRAQRGTFSGIALPGLVKYLKDLNISAVEFLPIHGFLGDQHLVKDGLHNYWGYDSISYFAPEPRYTVGGDINEFKTMVKVLHDEGIEVILDVVYNHTAEGNHMGPTLCFRGIDNLSYYRTAENNRYYDDTTGCGASFDVDHPRVLQLVMDSLRYWVSEMHVDGFRFDLATSLARSATGFNQNSGFLDAVAQDPVLQGVKLIAEPWDVGLGGYQVGAFPPGWAEWNDRYRDTIRRFWRGDERQIPDMAFRLSGSSDIFGHRGRRPWSSVNFITAHDGFTLNDLVSYNEKHNIANGEDNRDGTDSNWSWNCGVEGKTDDEEINDFRHKQMKNLMATLLLSQGTPMMTAGDEFCRTQQGNNNPYCQDNKISWIDWENVDDKGFEMLDFVRFIIQLRKEHPIFRRQKFFRGKNIPGTPYKDVVWYNPDGKEMSDENWRAHYARSVSFLLSGAGGESGILTHGEPDSDKNFFFILNAYNDAIEWKLPTSRDFLPWKIVFDTSRPEVERGRSVESGEMEVKSNSFVLLESYMRDEDVPDMHSEVLGNIERFAGDLVGKNSQELKREALELKENAKKLAEQDAKVLDLTKNENITPNKEME